MMLTSANCTPGGEAFSFERFMRLGGPLARAPSRQESFGSAKKGEKIR